MDVEAEVHATYRPKKQKKKHKKDEGIVWRRKKKMQIWREKSQN